MPLMREWTEIHVDEDLLVDVVRELLALAADPNHVEVVYGVEGRMILAEIHLADIWYQMRLARDKEKDASGSTEVHASGLEVVEVSQVEPSNLDSATTVPAPTRTPTPVVDAAEVVVRAPARVEPSTVAAAANVPTPAKRAPAPKPSASPNGEER